MLDLTPFLLARVHMGHSLICPGAHSAIPFRVRLHELAYFALCHVFVVICLPRLYLRYQYPTDILVSAPTGIALAALALFPPSAKSDGAFYHGLARSISRQLLRLSVCQVLRNFYPL